VCTSLHCELQRKGARFQAARTAVPHAQPRSCNYSRCRSTSHIPTNRARAPRCGPVCCNNCTCLAIAVRGIPTATTSATTSTQHRCPGLSTHHRRRHCSNTRCWHGGLSHASQQRATTPPRRAPRRLHANTTAVLLARGNDAVEPAHCTRCDTGVSGVQTGGSRLLCHG
jgi:hypothetical protein